MSDQPHGPAAGARTAIDALTTRVLQLVPWGHAATLVAWYPDLTPPHAMTAEDLARDVVQALDRLVGLTSDPTPAAHEHSPARGEVDIDDVAQRLARLTGSPRYTGEAGWIAVRDQPGALPHVERAALTAHPDSALVRGLVAAIRAHHTATEVTGQ